MPTGSFTPVATEEGGTKKTTKRCVIVVVAVVAILAVMLVAAALVYHLYSPQPDLLVQPTDYIVYNNNDQYIKDMELFVKDYEDKNEIDRVHECSNNNPPRPSTSCKFDTRWLDHNCNTDNQFGFPESTPCLILSPKLVPDWTPVVYDDLDELPDAMPYSLKEHITQRSRDNAGRAPPMLWVSCSDETVANNTGGEYLYTPWQGFPAYYFPYTNDMQDYYMTPLVGLQLDNIGNETQTRTIKCRTWAKNVDPEENPLTITISM